MATKNPVKYIFVLGGVISGLGKGIAAASIGYLLKSAGLRVTILKLDPYLNVDPGTMNPYQHGEVFVLDDGSETDLDLGHDERFIDESLSSINTTSSGRVYWDVLERERRGDYLGESIQVIPHITDEIKHRIKAVNIKRKYDFILTDSPPSITFETIQIVTVADGLFVPVQPSPVDLMATIPFLNLVKQERKKAIVILNRVMPRARLTDAIVMRLGYAGAKIARSRISSKVIYAETYSVGRGVVDISVTTDVSKEIINVGNEILRNL